MLINRETIVKDDDPRIREKSQDVELPLSKEDEETLRAMLQYVEDSTDEEKAEKLNLQPAVGISAIQIGIPKKMTAVVVHLKDKNDEDVTYKYMLVNPKIVSSSIQKAYLESGEGCLSVPNEHEGYVLRNARIKVKAFDLFLRRFYRRLCGDKIQGSQTGGVEDRDIIRRYPSRDFSDENLTDFPCYCVR